VQISYLVQRYYYFLWNSIWSLSTICSGKSWDHPRRPIHSGYPVSKFCHDWYNTVEVISPWIFVIHAWKSYSWPKIAFLGFDS